MDVEARAESMLNDFSLAQQRVMGRLVFFGETNAEIAKALDLSEKTVKAHVTALYKLTGCRHARQFLVWYFRGGIPETTKPQSELQVPTEA